MVQQILIGFFLAALQIIVGIVFTAGALYSGIFLLDRLTPNINEWKLIKKGNLAIGLFYATVMASIILMVIPRIAYIIDLMTVNLSIDVLLPFTVLFLFALINYLVAIFAALVIIFLTIHVSDKITSDVNEFEELEKGNISIALILSIVLLSVAWVSSMTLDALFIPIGQIEGIIFSLLS